MICDCLEKQAVKVGLMLAQCDGKSRCVKGRRVGLRPGRCNRAPLYQTWLAFNPGLLGSEVYHTSIPVSIRNVGYTIKYTGESLMSLYM